MAPWEIPGGFFARARCGASLATLTTSSVLICAHMRSYALVCARMRCHKTCGCVLLGGLLGRSDLPQNVWHCHKTCEGLAFAPCCDFLQNGTEDALPAIVDLGPILAGPLRSTSAYISGGELVATGSGKISARLRLYANLL